MSNSFAGPLPDPAADAGWVQDKQPRKGFFTDTSICIGCKACEVACKEWNAVPTDGMNFLGSSYDHSRGARRRHLAARQVHRAAQAARRPAAGHRGQARSGRPPPTC